MMARGSIFQKKQPRTILGVSTPNDKDSQYLSTN